MDTDVLSSFIKENCMMCGSQRCDPSELEWREGCSRWKRYKTREDILTGNSPKIIFISQPMSGLTIEQVLEKREYLKKLMEYAFGDFSITFIESFNPDALNNGRPLEELGECIKLLEDANIVLMANGWENSRGCKVEHFVAEAYDKVICYEQDAISIGIEKRLPRI